MKPDPYKKQKSREYQAKVRGRGGAVPRGAPRGRRGPRPNLGSNAFRFEDDASETNEAAVGALEEKQLLKQIEAVLDPNQTQDFFRLKDELDWGTPGKREARSSDPDLAGIDFKRICELIEELPLRERLDLAGDGRENRTTA